MGGNLTIEYDTKGLSIGEAFIILINQFPKKTVTAHPEEFTADGVSPYESQSATFNLPPGLVMIQFSVESRIDKVGYSTYWDALKDQYEHED